MQVMIMPTTGTGAFLDPRRPKYHASLLANYGTRYDSFPSSQCMVTSDISGLPLITLQLNLDILSYDANLDNPFTIVNTLLLFQTAHENRSLPVDWMALGMTFRTIARRVQALMKIGDRMHTQGYNFRSIGFDQPYTDYSYAEQVAWLNAVSAAGIDVNPGNIQTLTLRQALASVIGQVDNTPVAMTSAHII